MESIPSPVEVTTWPQVVAFCVVVICVLVVPSVLTYLGNQRVKTVEKTLTTTNGGSHVLDQLNRIESSVDTLRSDFEAHVSMDSDE